MFDLKRIEYDLLRIKVELEKALDEDDAAQRQLIIRNNSVKGRHFHVFNVLRKLKLREQWNKNYIKEEKTKVIVYITSCSVIWKTWERCKNAVALLSALDVVVEIRDLHMNSDLVNEIINRMGLSPEHRDFIFRHLPLIYVRGKYFGNHATLVDANEEGRLNQLLNDFKGRQKCRVCGDMGYTLCALCHGSKKSSTRFLNVELRCAFCDQNGIIPCSQCHREITS